MNSRSLGLATLIVSASCSAPIISNGPADGGPADSSADGFSLQPTDAKSFVLSGNDGASGGEVGANCRRSVNLTAVAIARPVPFDVVIVADNSDSLSWSRDSLSAGLRNLLSRVQGHEARFFVLTGTQYGASSQAAVSPITGKELVTWRDSVTRAPYAHPVTDYVQSCTDDKGAPLKCPGLNDTSTVYTLNGTWRFRLPPPVAAITPAMTEAQVAAQQRQLADAILALGGGGAQQEQPICTLNRYLTLDPGALPKNVVFVVLSDEDDASPPDACVGSYEAKRTSFVPEHYDFCNTGCDKYSYNAHHPAWDQGLKYTCVPVDDTGAAHPERAFDKASSFKQDWSCALPAGSACTPEQVTAAKAACGPGHQIRNCSTTCARSEGTKFSCHVHRPDTTVDLCTRAFDEEGKRYTNLFDYCRQKYNVDGWGECGYYGLKRSGMTSISQTESLKPLVPAFNTGGMIAAFKSKADAIFGRANYSVEAIILDPSFTCPVGPGQSYGSNLRQLATSAADVFALCQDYAPALRRVESFAEYLLQTEFALDLSVYEDVDSVLVTTRGGSQRTIDKTGYRYDRAAKKLRFHPGVLGALDDRLSVNVARYCEPVVK